MTGPKHTSSSLICELHQSNPMFTETLEKPDLQNYSKASLFDGTRDAKVVQVAIPALPGGQNSQLQDSRK